MQLPDMDFPVNALAEGRVLVPWEHRMYSNITIQNSTGKLSHTSFLLLLMFQPQLASSQYSGENSNLIGQMMVAFGKLGGGLVNQIARQGDYIHRYDPRSYPKGRIV